MANTDTPNKTYDRITRWLTDGDDHYADLFGYTYQTLRMVATYPDNNAFRQQALDIIHAVEDHKARTL